MRLLFFERAIGLPGENVEIHENQVMINRRALPVKILPKADFSWVPQLHKMGTALTAAPEGRIACPTKGLSLPPILTATAQTLPAGNSPSLV
jgi:hypothetical protein